MSSAHSPDSPARKKPHDFRWGASEIRQITKRLEELADVLDQESAVDLGTFTAARSEREAYLLLVWAEAEYRSRRDRAKFLDEGLLGEPAWDMLLDLFIQQARRRRISVTSLCMASRVPNSTALRWLAMLEEKALATRVAAVHDRRVQFVELTDRGLLAMSRWLRYRAVLPA